MLIALGFAVFLMIVDLTVNDRITLTYLGFRGNLKCTGVRFAYSDTCGLRIFWPGGLSKSIGISFYKDWDDYVLAFSW